MGGDDKSAVWNIRVTITPKNPIDRITKFCTSGVLCKNKPDGTGGGSGHAMLACIEEAESLHTHIAYVTNGPICRSTMKARLDKYLDLSGNADYSCSLPKDGQDVRGLYKYICKGTGPDYKTQGPNIFHNKAYILIPECHAAYWSAQEAFKEEVKTLAAKRQKDGIKEKYKIISELSLKYKGTEATPPVILNITTDVITAYKGNVNDNTLFTAVQAIAWEADPGQTCSQAGQRMLRKIFPQY